MSHCDPSTSILGHKSSIPIFVSGAALAKLGHPLGEANIARGAGRCNIIQMVSTNASLSPAQIAAARVSPDQALFFQLYKRKEDTLASKLIKEVEALGYSAIFLTVDAVVPGSRERDIKAPWVLEDREREVQEKAPVVGDPQDEAAGGILGTAGGLIIGNDADMTWEKVCAHTRALCSIRQTGLGQTIPWLRKATKLPIVIKGEYRVLELHTSCVSIGVKLDTLPFRNSVCGGKSHVLIEEGQPIPILILGRTPC